MKKVIYLAVMAMVAVACGASKNVASEETVKKELTSLDGQKMVQETIQMTDIDITKVLNEDGTKLVERPVKWFAAIGKADNKQVAIEAAQREAQSAVSRVINQMVLDNAKRGNLVNNGKVQQALSSYWEQVSTSIQKACEPYGDVVISYYPATGMYEAIAKVGIRGDKYNAMLNEIQTVKPADLSPEEQKAFIETNKNILDAARGFN